MHALIFTAVYSRHMFVWLTFRQTLAAVIEGCEAAWAFFGGVFAVLIPDNLTPVITAADPVKPTFTVGWLDYAQDRGFGTDPARVRSPKDKPRVERIVQYVRGNFFAGETFTDLADAQLRAQAWCLSTAGLRVHGTTAQRALEHFTATEAPALIALPDRSYDVPIFATPKVARDLHIELARSLYSVPAEFIGQRVDVRADSRLVKVFHRGQLIKTHPRVAAGSRSTDPGDYPVGRADYALRDVTSLAAKAAAAGPAVGVYATRLLDTPLPWTRMRTVYRLLVWSGPTAPARSRRPAPDRWSSTSWISPRSPACSNKPPSVTPASQPPWSSAARPGSPATPTNSAPHANPTGR
ncbi:MAG: Integrase catalytic region [Pseudonocardiales bacterium]|nr:Integrase catalytic region [Pseudonocardiales bacterium]